jgi:anti-anti-sigma factor
MLRVGIYKPGEVAILRLRGRIVNGETRILRKVVLSLSDASVIVLDFAQVKGIDAHGLGVLLDLRQELQSKGIEFRLMNVMKLVRQVLAITKLDTVFKLTTETEMAAAASAESAKRKRRARGDAPRLRSEQ